MSNNNNVYDEMKKLFNIPDDDKRWRLFIHAQLSANPLNKYFVYSDSWEFKINPSTNAEFIKNTEYDPEFIWFIIDFVDCLIKLINNPPPNHNAQKKIYDSIYAQLSTSDKVGFINFVNEYHPIYEVDTSNFSFGQRLSSKNINDIKSLATKVLGLTKITYDSYVIKYNNKLTEWKGKKVFSYKINRQILLDSLETAKNGTSNSTSSTYLKNLTLPSDNDEYFRDASQPNKLFKIDSSNNRVEVQKGSKMYKETLYKSDNCSGFNVFPADQGRCNQYLMDCIHGNDPDKCRKYMESKDFWDSTDAGIVAEVKNMLPSLAIMTLNKFEFEKETFYHSGLKKNIYKIQSVNTWLQDLQKKMSKNPNEYKKIADNNNLTQYLTLLVDKINNSPAIINDNITIPDTNNVYNPDKFAGQLLHKYGMKAKLPSYNISSRTAMIGNHAKLSLNAPSRIIFGFGLPLSGMRGGGVDARPTSVALEEQYNILKNMLKTHGKELDSQNDKEIISLLTQFKNTENKLFQTMKLIDKYLELMSVFEYNDPHKLLNLETLDSIVKAHETQLSKSNKKQNTLLQAIQTLADVVQDAVSTNSTNTQTTRTTGLPTNN
jgi:hypothetical protein